GIVGKREKRRKFHSRGLHRQGRPIDHSVPCHIESLVPYEFPMRIISRETPRHCFKVVEDLEQAVAWHPPLQFIKFRTLHRYLGEIDLRKKRQWALNGFNRLSKESLLPFFNNKWPFEARWRKWLTPKLRLRETWIPRGCSDTCCRKCQLLQLRSKLLE